MARHNNEEQLFKDHWRNNSCSHGGEPQQRALRDLGVVLDELAVDECDRQYPSRPPRNQWQLGL